MMRAPTYPKDAPRPKPEAVPPRVLYSATMTIILLPLRDGERPAFIADLQEAFEHFQGNPQGSFVGQRIAARERADSDHLGDAGAQRQPILPLSDIEESLNAPGARAYRLVEDGICVGNAVLTIDGDEGEVLLFAMNAAVHSKGIGTRAWSAIEAAHPQVAQWELETPYFEVRNIHFYVNKCGFHIVEFFNEHHPGPSGHLGDPASWQEGEQGGADYMFRFVRRVERR